MAQKTSFFNWGLSRSWLKRCWPLWTTYLAVWLIALPQSVPELRRYSDILSYTVNVNTNVVRLGQNMAEMSIFAGIIAAMLMYSYMYSSRSCGMMNALPVRRETVFTTAFITGLVPFLIADVIVIAAAWAVYARTGVVETKNIFLALGFAVMGNIAFYGFAAFCAVLTGSLVVLPAVYLVLGCTAAVVEPRRAERARLADIRVQRGQVLRHGALAHHRGDRQCQRRAGDGVHHGGKI